MESFKQKYFAPSTGGLFPSPSEEVIQFITPFCDALGFKALPPHLHVILAGALFYQLIFLLSPLLCAPIKSYTTLRRRSKINWDIHVVSMVQSLIIVWLAYLALGDPLLKENRAFGYSPFGADVAALACGYFVWDSYVSLKYVRMFGWGFALHGLASFYVFLFGFRPFLMYYGPAVLFFELSTPFLNIHWFSDKFRLTGSNFQIANGIVLILVFFCSRILGGWYITYHFTLDILHARKTNPELTPLWLASLYITANLFLNFLNIYWFSKMIDSIRRRADAKPSDDHND